MKLPQLRHQLFKEFAAEFGHEFGPKGDLLKMFETIHDELQAVILGKLNCVGYCMTTLSSDGVLLERADEPDDPDLTPEKLGILIQMTADGRSDAEGKASVWIREKLKGKYQELFKKEFME